MSDDPLNRAPRSASSSAASSRRGVVLGAAGLAVAGAAGGLQWLKTARAAELAERNELVVALDGAGVTKFVLDPHNSAYAPHHRMMRAIYDSLTVLLPDQTIGPWLAESWEISPDGKTYDFRLRRGVRFHDGAVFDAHAVKVNFDRLGHPKSTLSSRRNLGPFESSEVLADDVIRLRLKQPYAPLLRNLSMTRLAMVSPAAVARYGKTFSQHPVGTGPFRFTGMSAGTEVRLERNPDYQWSASTALHQGPARIERLTFKNVAEQATRTAVLLSGQANVADYIPPQDVAVIERHPDFNLLEQELLNTNYGLTLNARTAPWGDEQARLAFRLSLDIDQIVDVIYRGTLRRAWSPLSPGMYGSLEKELAGSWSPDPSRADAIFDRLGWRRGADGYRAKDGERLSVLFLESQGNRERRLDVVRLIRAQLRERGVDLRVGSTPPGSAAEMARNNTYQLSGGAQFAPDPDVLRTYYSANTKAAASTSIRIQDKEVIAWLEAAAQEPDGPRRAELYAKVQRKIIDQTYVIPIYVLIYNIAASKQVEGLQIDPHGFPLFNSASLKA